MSDAKASFAECTIRSLKKILCRYMDAYRSKYIHALFQFVATLNSRKNCSADLIPEGIMNSNFLSILYSQPVREYWKPNIKIGDRVRIYKYDWLFTRSYKPHFTQEFFWNCCTFSQKNQIHTQWRMSSIAISAVTFIRNSWSKLFNSGIVCNRVDFKCFCAATSRQYTELLYKLFTRATESGRSMGSCIFGKVLPIKVPKRQW